MMDDALHHAFFSAGPLRITGSVVFTWLIMALLAGVGWLSTRRLSRAPGLVQTAAEGIVLAMQGAVRGVIPEHYALVLPFVGTLWVFLIAANLIGLVPGLDSPTADLSVTAAMGVTVFLSVHWFGIRASGAKAYFGHFLSPSPLLLPFHVVGELTRTVALAVRLFGNMMSMEIAAVIMLSVAGLIVPLPIMMLHIVEALVQAYIFGILALVYIGGGMQSQQHNRATRSST